MIFIIIRYNVVYPKILKIQLIILEIQTNNAIKHKSKTDNPKNSIKKTLAKDRKWRPAKIHFVAEFDNKLLASQM